MYHPFCCYPVAKEDEATPQPDPATGMDVKVSESPPEGVGD